MLKDLDNIIGIEAVRGRMGANAIHGLRQDDKSYDDQISQMSPKEFVSYYCGWHLGDEAWGKIIISVLESAQKHYYNPYMQPKRRRMK